jgi:hypothetical protein
VDACCLRRGRDRSEHFLGTILCKLRVFDRGVIEVARRREQGERLGDRHGGNLCADLLGKDDAPRDGLDARSDPSVGIRMCLNKNLSPISASFSPHASTAESRLPSYALSRLSRPPVWSPKPWPTQARPDVPDRLRDPEGMAHNAGHEFVVRCALGSRRSRWIRSAEITPYLRPISSRSNSERSARCGPAERGPRPEPRFAIAPNRTSAWLDRWTGHASDYSR